jgi:hypothetical protein
MMKCHLRNFLTAMAALAAFWPIVQVFGQEEAPTKIVLHPMAAPRPALKYQLLPPFIERRPGNAAVQYLKLPHEQTYLFSNSDFWETLQKWNEMPLPELRKVFAEDKQCTWITDSNSMTWEFLERGSRCESVDWDLPIREYAHRTWMIRLPDIQSARSWARILSPRVRVQIAEGKYDEAIKTFQVGMAFGRHVGDQQCFLVQSLVGITIARMMLSQMETFVQQPEAPNLYWALASLPKPFVSLHHAFEVEASWMELCFPELRDIDKKEYSPEQWRQHLENLIQVVVDLHGGGDSPKITRPMIMNTMIAAYPRAKQYLIEHGRSAESVEAMPVAQALVLFTMHTYREICDENTKYLSLPYAQYRKWEKLAEKQMREGFRSEAVPLASTLLPAVSAAKSAETRVDRDIAALQVLEALRIYGAAHNSQLPENLNDITEVPIPCDPFTDEPFVYHRNGDTAVLESQVTTYRSGNDLRYEIRFANKEEK